MRHLALVCIALFAAPAARAQAADSVRHLPADVLAEAVAAAPGEQARTFFARTVADGGAYTILAVRRTADGEAEVHAEWTDVILVQQGTATLLTGGEVHGARQTGPGELRGGQIVGGTRRTVTAGDVVTIPAGVPHQMLIAPDHFFTFLVIKVRRGEASSP